MNLGAGRRVPSGPLYRSELCSKYLAQRKPNMATEAVEF